MTTNYRKKVAMNYAILRTTKLKTMGNIGGSLAHSYRTIETQNADPNLTPKNHHSVATPEAVKQAIKDRLPEKSGFLLRAGVPVTARYAFIHRGRQEATRSP